MCFGVEAAIEVDEGVLGPELFLELVAGDHAALLLKQGSQYLERLGLQVQADAVLAQLAYVQIDFKWTELCQLSR